MFELWHMFVLLVIGVLAVLLGWPIFGIWIFALGSGISLGGMYGYKYD